MPIACALCDKQCADERGLVFHVLSSRAQATALSSASVSTGLANPLAGPSRRDRKVSPPGSTDLPWAESVVAAGPRAGLP